MNSAQPEQSEVWPPYLAHADVQCMLNMSKGTVGCGRATELSGYRGRSGLEDGDERA